MTVETESPLKKYIRCRKVGFVPVDYSGFIFDDDIISRGTGLFPDVLSDFTEEQNYAPLTPCWRSIWFTVNVPEDCPPGDYPIEVSLKKSWIWDGDDRIDPLGTYTYTLKVLDAVLPPQTLKNTHWFHADCLAQAYHAAPFSEDHWRIIGNFMKNAAEHGINMILTPLVTPPLDTVPGKERMTVQLVRIRRDRGKYSFDFSLLERWIALAQSCGMKYFEMAPLFTQWGARFTPKILAEVDGRPARIFGWDVASDSAEYREFLSAFLPALTDYLRQKKLEDVTYFHCSDEPAPEHLETYRRARNLLKKLIRGFKSMNALASVEFYRKGLVDIPVPIETSFEDFEHEDVPEKWIYYCCAPCRTFSNRFIFMPSSRSRIFGALMYRYKIEGFLHYGFNFYNSGLSRFPIDPYKCNSADCFYPAGDSFLVYPGRDGMPEDSIRHEVFFEALQDQRALNLLESEIGREKVLKMLDAASPAGVFRMDQYPKGEESVLKLREKINRRLMKNTQSVTGGKRHQ